MSAPRFSLGKLLVAVTCMAIAAGVVSGCIALAKSPRIVVADQPTLVMMFLIMAAPLILGIAGAGVGTLWSHPFRGAAIGTIAGLVIAHSVFIVAFSLAVIREL